MADVGRPRHAFWNLLGFNLLTTKTNGKSNNVAHCLQCQKNLQNTAIKKLQSHR